MKRVLKISVLLAVIFWLGGFVYFFSSVVPHRRAADDRHADAIVVFTGLENMRDRQGLESYRAGIAPRLLISGVTPTVTKARLLHWLYRQPPGDLKLDFSLGYQATNTVGNAEETASWACVNHVRSIRLMTADYHMPRALYLLNLAWPDAQVIPDPLIAPYGHKEDRLLYRAWGVWQSFVEYHKLAVQRARIRLGLLFVPQYHCAPPHQQDLDDD